MKKNSQLNQLIVLWTSGDKEVALNMVFMYTLNAKKRGWWNEICLIVWGPSAKLLSEDTELQEYLSRIRAEGVRLEACKSCTDRYGVSEKLEKLGIDVRYMGIPFTEYLKEDYKMITI